MGRANTAAALIIGCVAMGCHVGDNIITSTGDGPTFEQFESEVYLEPWVEGVYIVNGDTPIENEKKLREFYDELYSEGALVVHRSGAGDARWNDTQKRNLTYCISDSFGTRKAQVIAAIDAATQGAWETAADVDFIYVPSQDGSCTASNSSVVFDVRPTSGAPYLARAFFPNQSRGSRNVIIDNSAFGGGWPLEDVLAHELGHALGFRHEHTRPEAGQCYEDDNWRPLTPYDSASVMHYPQCGGTGPALTMSNRDRDGAALLYGAAAGDGEGDGGDPDPGGDDTGDTGTTQTGSASGSVAQGASIQYEPLAVVPGSRFEVSISGTGDADLYLRFDAQPSQTQYDCRPYLDGSAESCSLDVPAGASSAYLMVYGYSNATYTLDAAWVAP